MQASLHMNDYYLHLARRYRLIGWKEKEQWAINIAASYFWA
jgi:hypothetical protein